LINLSLIRPLKDFENKDIYMYLWASGILNLPVFKLNFEEDIRDICKDFISNLQIIKSNTVHTIIKTAGKTKLKSIFKLCYLCLGIKDTID